MHESKIYKKIWESCAIYQIVQFRQPAQHTYLTKIHSIKCKKEKKLQIMHVLILILHCKIVYVHDLSNWSNLLFVNCSRSYKCGDILSNFCLYLIVIYPSWTIFFVISVPTTDQSSNCMTSEPLIKVFFVWMLYLFFQWNKIWMCLRASTQKKKQNLNALPSPVVFPKHRLK